MEPRVSLAERTTVLIVGGDKGHGAELAISLGRRKANLIIPYWTTSRLANEVVSAIENVGGIGMALPADVTMRSHFDVLLATGAAAFGKVDVVVWCRETPSDIAMQIVHQSGPRGSIKVSDMQVIASKARGTTLCSDGRDLGNLILETADQTTHIRLPALCKAPPRVRNVLAPV